MPGVFINYRTGDGDATASHVDDKLRRFFGDDNVFRDRRSMTSGTDFPPELRRRLENSTVLLVLIGGRWLDIETPDGRRRIDVDGDYVLEEIRCALSWRKVVIPVLLDNARLPAVGDLPPDISDLSSRQQIVLRTPYMHRDLDWLVEEVARHIPPAPETTQEKTGGGPPDDRGGGNYGGTFTRSAVGPKASYVENPAPRRKKNRDD
ncbi:toll/interleukin-1 receptor domain-containing protein [Embleya sp. NPDC050493]|uniref:toll/interleukin-1 receptor domain-containing protein n=1 Tax=Embleya sp. NPDC050493 TaxID=3363989 RepID=UPI00379A08FF